jgi:hypothetical protein
MNRIARLFGYLWPLVVLAGCAAAPPSSPWYLGEFRVPKSNGNPEMLVTCKPNEKCAVLMGLRDGPLTPVEIPMKPPIALDPTIPNNNFATTRRAVAENPRLYEDQSFGPMLTPLRSMLDTGAKFAHCVDLDGTAYLALCSLSSDPRGEKSIVLLMSTMNGACGTMPFCAYYFMPLSRTKAR